MFSVKFYEYATIRTCLNNLINLKLKHPHFLGVWGGILQFMTYNFSFRI